MYCSLSDQVKSSMLLGQRRRRPVCRMLKVDILGRQDHRDSLSAVDGALRCCGSVAGTVQTSMAVPCRVDHDAESERDTLRDVQPMCRITVLPRPL